VGTYPDVNRRNVMLFFHWTTVLLVTASFAIAWTRTMMEDLPERAFWLDIHRTIGFVVLALTLVRLAGRALVGPPSNGADLPLGYRLASRVVHLLLYAGLIAIPLLGWAQSSARARHFNLFGISVPALVRHDRDFADVLGWWHENLAWALLALILVHALAALYHHYVLRDDVLRAMLPAPRGQRRMVDQPGLLARLRLE